MAEWGATIVTPNISRVLILKPVSLDSGVAGGHEK
jgi:hypothetical protein